MLTKITNLYNLKTHEINIEERRKKSINQIDLKQMVTMKLNQSCKKLLFVNRIVLEIQIWPKKHVTYIKFEIVKK